MQKSIASIRMEKTWTKKCPGYNNTQSDSEAPVLELSLPLHRGSLWDKVVVPVKIQS